eukprot:TRINITY_DN6868_c1_g1_i1.p1 TRINITY_DN6868_c1_g1~~TRINITY_DN6868_c1_g1_i1.p1  ORF type:complete len:290 (-),score=54.65 TRINITY_DN6868_c1_g1_i1:5-874(-)
MDGMLELLTDLAKAGNGTFHDCFEANVRKMEATFSAVSTTFTSTRTTISTKKKEKINLDMEDADAWKLPSGWSHWYQGLILTYCADNDTFTPKGTEQPVSLREKPFAKGGERYAYHLRKHYIHYVAKESIYDEAYNDRLRFHKSNAKSHFFAQNMATIFNSKLEKAGVQHSIQFVDSIVIRIRLSPSTFRYLSCEEWLEGHFTKYNSNNGWLSEKEDFKNFIAQAFTHFSYEFSGKRSMVCDIQGVGLKFTDPQIHSVDKEFGRGDLGQEGFEQFMASHKCNEFCRAVL